MVMAVLIVTATPFTFAHSISGYEEAAIAAITADIEAKYPGSNFVIYHKLYSSGASSDRFYTLIDYENVVIDGVYLNGAGEVVVGNDHGLVDRTIEYRADEGFTGGSGISQWSYTSLTIASDAATRSKHKLIYIHNSTNDLQNKTGIDVYENHFDESLTSQGNLLALDNESFRIDKVLPPTFTWEWVGEYVEYLAGTEQFIETSLYTPVNTNGLNYIYYLRPPVEDGIYTELWPKKQSNILIASDSPTIPFGYNFYHGSDSVEISFSEDCLVFGPVQPDGEVYHIYTKGESVEYKLNEGQTIYSNLSEDFWQSKSDLLHGLHIAADGVEVPNDNDQTVSEFKLKDYVDTYWMDDKMMSVSSKTISNLDSNQIKLYYMFHYADLAEFNDDYPTKEDIADGIKITGATVVGSKIYNYKALIAPDIEHRYLLMEYILQLEDGTNDIRADFIYDKIQYDGTYEPRNVYDYIYIHYNTGEPDGTTIDPTDQLEEVKGESFQDMLMMPFEKLYEISKKVSQYFSLTLLNLIPNWIPAEIIAMILFSLALALVLRILGR